MQDLKLQDHDTT